LVMTGQGGAICHPRRVSSYFAAGWQWKSLSENVLAVLAGP
jgi:hypothetical protein